VHNSFEPNEWRAIKFIITAVHPSFPGRPFHIPETHPYLQANPFIKLSDSSSVTEQIISSSTNNFLHLFSKQSDFFIPAQQSHFHRHIPSSQRIICPTLILTVFEPGKYFVMGCNYFFQEQYLRCGPISISTHLS